MSGRVVAVLGGGLVLLAMAFGATASSWRTAEALTNCTTATAGLDGDETSVATQINQQRAANGLPPLLVSPNLNRAAGWKSADSSNTSPPPVFSHTDSLGRSPSTRAQQCGYPSGAGENIAFGYSAGTVVGAWMNSSGHRANILSPNYRVMGVGHTGSSWVTNFGAVVDEGAFQVGSPQPPPPSPSPTASPTPRPTQPPTGGGGSNPTAEPTQPSNAEPSPTLPPPPKTAVSDGSGPIPAAAPATVPFRRATIMMLASE